MSRHRRLTCFLALLSFAPGAGLADGLVKEFQGREDATTEAFEVEAPWLLHWRVGSDFPKALGFEVSLLDGTTGMHAGRVLRRKQTGNGIRLFSTGGRYRFRIDSKFGLWSLIVEEISAEEAERYKPARRPLIEDSLRRH